jgi:hypothetical protein
MKTAKRINIFGPIKKETFQIPRNQTSVGLLKHPQAHKTDELNDLYKQHVAELFG